MDLQEMYKRLDVSHLSVDEVEHELLIRNILFGLAEHESVKRRKLKDRLKEERGMGIVSYSPTWRHVTEEISVIKSQLMVIHSLLENPKTLTRLREKLRTRLIHYRVRILSLSSVPQARKHLQEIMDIGKQATYIFHRFFPELTLSDKEDFQPKQLEQDLSKALVEIRSEIDDLNETVCGKIIELDTEENVEKSESNKQSVENKEKEKDESLKRADYILEKLTQFEQGGEENVLELIPFFRNFVMQTTQQQKEQREKEIAEEKRRIKAAEENVERKKRLEKLLINLNETIKPESQSQQCLDSDHKEESRFRRKTPTELWNTKPIKISDLSELSDRSTASEGNNECKKYQREKKTNDHRNENLSLSRRNRERRQKVYFSSETFESTSTESSESFTTSTESSSWSSDEKKKRRNKRNKRKYGYSIKRIPVSEWKLKYDGKDGGRKLAEFLKEVKMRCKAEKISDKELFRSAIHLFIGRAKDWFMEVTNNRDIRNWSQLKADLKREFLPPNLDFQLEIQATNRTQGRGERFVDYFHDMQKYFQSMTREISERRKFDIVWRNMRTDYKNALTGKRIKSLTRLRRYGRIVDENYWNNYQKPYENPPRNRYNQVNELSTVNKSVSFQNSFKSTNNLDQKEKLRRNNYRNTQQNQVESKTKEKTESQLEPMEGSSKGTLKLLCEQYKRPPWGICYNCRKQGHHYNECDQEKHKFCHLCGFPDTYTKTCPLCTKNEENSA